VQEKKAEAFAATFEKECKEGTTSDSRLKFAEYCEYVISLKEQRGIKHSTISSYRDLAARIYPVIGHIKLKDLRADHLNDLYTLLSQKGARKGEARAAVKMDLAAWLKDRKITRVGIAKNSGIPDRVVSAAVKGEKVSIEAAKAISDTLGLPLEDAFEIKGDNRPLSAKTVLEHHRLISTVLDQAEKEGLVPFNVARKATLPKIQRKEVNYFQPEQVAAIRAALELEPIKWQTLVHMLLITGARRGEILGLKWDNVDFTGKRIRICNNILYRADRGIYEDSPKTSTSDRYIALPVETMQLLRQYRAWQNEERLRFGEYFDYQGFVFSQDNGKPMHPDSVTSWLSKFSKRHGLPHINPHAFRHTMASMLYFNGVDSISISKRLGHSKVSTTTDIYSHVIEAADQKSADILADIFLKKA